jgi:acetyl esterase/lipase
MKITRYFVCAVRVGCLAGALAVAVVGAPVRAQQSPAASEGSMPGVAKIDRNVIFGMYSGLALVMDVYHPVKPNGYGAIFIAGSAWGAPMDYGASPLKDDPGQVPAFALPLVAAGYTIFDIDHRATPRFHFPAQIEDAERAVRFVRYHARQFGINPARIGAVGYSSGAHLASLLGLMTGAGNASDRDPVQRESARVQCVIAGGTPADLEHVGNNPAALAMLSGFLGQPVPADPAPASAVFKQLEAASPIHWVKPGAPPFLLIHGDADELVPIEAAQEFQKALQNAHVPVKLITIKGGTHASVVALESAEYAHEMVQWLGEYLLQGGRKP